MNFLHGASCGDVIYSLPYIKHLDSSYNRLYIAQTNLKKRSTYQILKDLLNYVSYIDEVRPYDPLLNKNDINIDLTIFRQHSKFYKTHLIQNYFDSFQAGNYYYSPWIDKYYYNDNFSSTKTNNFTDYSFVCVSVTDRYRTGFNWIDKIKQLIYNYDYVFFVGHPEEFNNFKHIEGLQYFETYNFLDVLKLFSDRRFKGLYCNQNGVLTIAQSIDAQVYLEEDVKYKTAHIKRNKECLIK